MVIGLVLPIIMSLVLYFFVYRGDLVYGSFLSQLVRTGNMGRLLSVSVLPNLLVFFIAVNKERLLAARGIVTSTILYAIAVFVLRFLM